MARFPHLLQHVIGTKVAGGLLNIIKGRVATNNSASPRKESSERETRNELLGTTCRCGCPCTKGASHMSDTSPQKSIGFEPNDPTGNSTSTSRICQTRPPLPDGLSACKTLKGGRNKRKTCRPLAICPAKRSGRHGTAEGITVRSRRAAIARPIQLCQLTGFAGSRQYDLQRCASVGKR